MKARALLDFGSSTSFVSNRLTRSLCLCHSQQLTRISGIAGLTHSGSSHAVTTFHVSSLGSPNKQFDVSAIITPQVTCHLPASSVSFDLSWNHPRGLQLADLNFGNPGTIDLLLGIDMFVTTLLYGWRSGPPGFPTALETEFGWVLAGNADPLSSTSDLVSHHVFLSSGDDLLRQFWEAMEPP